MYSSSLKKLAEEIEKVHIPDEFKFYDDEIDLMEIYEELFVYFSRALLDYFIKINILV